MTKLLLVALSIIAPVASLSAAPRELPSIDELHQMLRDKQYRPLLKEIARISHMRGLEARYDRGELLLLKAEALLQTRKGPAALAVLREASEADTEPRHAARAKVTETLLTRSIKYKYSPQAGDAIGQEIDILADREAALKALAGEELALLKVTLKELRDKRNLPAIFEGHKKIKAYRAIELVTTEKTEQSDALQSELSRHAADLLEQTLNELDARVDEIDAAARAAPPDEVSISSTQPVALPRHKGLSDPERDELEQIRETCGKISPAVDELIALFAPPDDRFSRSVDVAIRLSAKARDALDDDAHARIPSNPESPARMDGSR